MHFINLFYQMFMKNMTALYEDGTVILCKCSDIIIIIIMVIFKYYFSREHIAHSYIKKLKTV